MVPPKRSGASFEVGALVVALTGGVLSSSSCQPEPVSGPDGGDRELPETLADAREEDSILDSETPPDAGPGDAASRDEASRDVSSCTECDAEPADSESTKDSFSFEEVALADDPLAVTEIRFLPGRNEFLLLEKGGKVRHYLIAGAKTELLGSFMVAGVNEESDCGLISAAFDPNFADNHFVYFGYCSSPQWSRISRHVLISGDYPRAETGVEVISVGHADAPAAWHNVGSIGFDDAGNLWGVFGDKVVTGSSQDRTSNLGSLVRVVPSPADGDGGYAVPPTNPFAGGDAGLSPAIYAFGFRSPWRAAVDSRGRYWVGDVGESTYEEVDLVSGGGQNFAWPMAEGPCVGDCSGARDPVAFWGRTLTDPRARDDHQTPDTTRRVVWIGGEYRDRGNDRYAARLTGRMLYGDFCAGWVRAMEVGADDKVTSDELLTHLESITSWDQAPDGYLYAVTYGNCFTFPYRPGRMWRLRYGR